MLASSRMEPRFAEWNRCWKAPSGSAIWRRLLPARLWDVGPLARLVGPFAFQPNSSNREFEYPWAFHMAGVQAGQVVLDVGGGHSGFAYVLSRAGAAVTVVDPFVPFGSARDYEGDPVARIRRMNRALGTSVDVRRARLADAGLEPATVDTVFCISTLEHLSEDERRSAAREIGRVLRITGRLVATVDLFLNLRPFSDRLSNRYGENISVLDFVSSSGLELEVGDTRELFGYGDFRASSILANLEKYRLAIEYPLLSQLLVLRRAA